MASSLDFCRDCGGSISTSAQNLCPLCREDAAEEVFLLHWEEDGSFVVEEVLPPG